MPARTVNIVKATKRARRVTDSSLSGMGTHGGATGVILPPEIAPVPDTLPSQERVTYRACHLCEALCGLEIRSRGDVVVAVRGDAADPFSRGHVCPKAPPLLLIHAHPIPLHRPVPR